MRPVEFGEALTSGTRLTLFSNDKPDRFFRVIKFCMDETLGIALALKTGVPSYQVEDRKAEFIYCFTCRSRKSIKAAGASGGPITQDLIRDRFLMARWLRNREAGVMAAPATLPPSRMRARAMECWIVTPSANWSREAVITIKDTGAGISAADSDGLGKEKGKG